MPACGRAATGMTAGRRRSGELRRSGARGVNEVGWDVIVVLVILLVGGFFSGAEMALVSLREGQVRSLSQRGKRGQRAAKLASDPNRFLSAVQIGVTVATLLSGAFGAATLAAAMKSALISDGVSAAWASVLSFLTVTVAISFLRSEERRVGKE